MMQTSQILETLAMFLAVTFSVSKIGRLLLYKLEFLLRFRSPKDLSLNVRHGRLSQLLCRHLGQALYQMGFPRRRIFCRSPNDTNRSGFGR